MSTVLAKLSHIQYIPVIQQCCCDEAVGLFVLWCGNWETSTVIWSEMSYEIALTGDHLRSFCQVISTEKQMVVETFSTKNGQNNILWSLYHCIFETCVRQLDGNRLKVMKHKVITNCSLHKHYKLQFTQTSI